MLAECSNKGFVEIKGMGDSLGLILHQSGSFEQIEHELEYLLNEQGKLDFFRGSDIVLHSGKRVLSDGEFHRLQNLLLNEGDLALQLPPPPRIPEFSESSSFFRTAKAEPPLLKPSSFVASKDTVFSVSSEPSQISFPAPVIPSVSSSTASDSLKSTEKSKLSEQNPSTEALEEPKTKKQELTEKQLKPEANVDLFPGINTGEALMIRQTLRSGQKICSSKSVIVFGDLNSGAEVISDQDIIILGVIRGTVHAGANGNSNAKILGLRMIPTQIRINTFISQPPQADNPNLVIVGPERAFVEDGQIIVENNTYTSEQLLPLLSEAHRSKRKVLPLRVPSISVGAVRL